MVKKIMDEYSDLPTTHLRYYYRHKELCSARQKTYHNSPEGKSDTMKWREENKEYIQLYGHTKYYIYRYSNYLKVGDYIPLDEKILKRRIERSRE